MRISGIPSTVATAFGVLALSVVIGVGVAVASSPSSLSARLGGEAAPLSTTPPPSALPTSSPSLAATPIPSPLKPGKLGSNPTLLIQRSAKGLVASGGSVTLLSLDGGRTWTPAALPAGAAGITYDAADPNRAIAGGIAVSVTADGGATWKPPKTAPPGPGPYQPLLISPSDGTIWFFVRHGNLLRTRDAGVSWKEIPAAKPLGTATMIAGGTPDQFFLASDAQVLSLDNQTAQLSDAGSLPGGAKALGMALAAGNPRSLLARASDGKSYLLKSDGWHPSGSSLAGPVAAAPNGIMWVGDGGAKLGQPGNVEASFDGGKTWTAGTGLPADQSVDALAAEIDTGRIFAYCFGGDLYTSGDGGKTWGFLSSSLRSQ